MIFLTSPGKTYSVNSISGCTISVGGTTLATIPANIQTTFIAPEEEVIVSDDNAIIVEVTGVGAGGSGGSGGSDTPSLKFEVVDVLPEQGEDGIIYLVPTGESGDNKYAEWVWVNGSYEQMGTASIDLSGLAVLQGGNTFTGNQTVEGDVTINGTLTVSGEVTTEGEYIGAEVIETSDTTITPEAGKYYKYTGTEDTITVSAPVWNGYMAISYLETAVPVGLEGVTWSPAKPSLTGAGPFVYTLVCAESGKVLASAMNYSVATAEAVQKVMPIAWSEYSKAPTGANFERVLVIGNGAVGGSRDSLVIGDGAKTTGRNSTAVGGSATAAVNGTALGMSCYAGGGSVGVGQYHTTNGAYSVGVGSGIRNVGNNAVSVGQSSYASSQATTVGYYAASSAAQSVTIGARIAQDIEGQHVNFTCTTEGTGSITIGAGANTLNTTTTVDGVETTVESSNSITIGCKASNSGADSVVIGASATVEGAATVAIGAKASAKETAHWGSGTAVGNKATANSGGTAIGERAIALNGYSIAVGGGTKAGYSGVSVGQGAYSAGESIAVGYAASSTDGGCIAIGSVAVSSKARAIALGAYAKAADYGATVIRSTAGDNTYTQLYFSGANTPLAKKYFPTAWEQKQDVDEQGNPKVDESGNPVMVDDKTKPIAGEAMMGFVARDKDGNIIARGANMLSALFPYYNGDNENPFTPTTMSLDGENQEPIAFHPSDLDMPIEEAPIEEEYTPLPVYPIVEPEIPAEP